MKSLMALILCLSFSAHARYRYWAPVVVGSTVGTIAYAQYSMHQALRNFELKGWAHKETGTTVNLEDQCKVQAEFHLVGDNRRIYLILGVANPTLEAFAIKYSDVKFIMDGTRERFPGYAMQASDYRLGPGWWAINWVPFPSKDEFKQFSTLKVVVPIINEKDNSVCKIESEFKRTKHVPNEDFSYSFFEVNFHGGPSIAQAGGITKLGRPGGMFGFDFNFFGAPNHGFGMTMLMEGGFSGSNNQDVQDAFYRGRNYSATVSNFGPQYVYRHFISERLTFHYEPGLTFQSISDNNRYRNNGVSDSFATIQKLMVHWNFNRWRSWYNDFLDFYMGVGIVHLWSPHERLHGQDVSGQRMGALLRIGIGI